MPDVFIRYASGVTAIYNTFQGTWQPFEMVIMTTKTTYQFRIDTGRIYGAAESHLRLYGNREKYAGAGRSAHRIGAHRASSAAVPRAGGAEVRLSDIPADDPGYSGDTFEREYAQAAAKIYLGQGR